MLIKIRQNFEAVKLYPYSGKAVLWWHFGLECSWPTFSDPGRWVELQLWHRQFDHLSATIYLVGSLLLLVAQHCFQIWQSKFLINLAC